MNEQIQKQTKKYPYYQNECHNKKNIHIKSEKLLLLTFLI